MNRCRPALLCQPPTTVWLASLSVVQTECAGAAAHKRLGALANSPRRLYSAHLLRASTPRLRARARREANAMHFETKGKTDHCKLAWSAASSRLATSDKHS